MMLNGKNIRPRRRGVRHAESQDNFLKLAGGRLKAISALCK